MAKKSAWYLDGYDAGAEAANDNLSHPEARKDLERRHEEDRLGEFVGELREHQIQFEGDISYDVGRSGGPTERQYELWEEGFTDGFIRNVERALEEEDVEEE